MAKNFITYILPAHWASAIINLDYSSLDLADIQELNQFMTDNELNIHNFVSCSDYETLNTFNGKLCMTLDYDYKT